MNRRLFLTLFGASSSTLLLSSPHKMKEYLPTDTLTLIYAVQQHMFPEGSTIPSAKSFNAIGFLNETVSHSSFDKDIRKFIIDGSEKLQKREKSRFLHYNSKEMEIALRSYEETSYGSGWLDRIVLLCLEGLLSDPIYGGNSEQSGWKALQTRGGEPRSTSRYIEL